MSISPSFDQGSALWENVVSAEAAIRNSLRAFLAAPSASRVAIIREALGKPGGERAAAVRVLPHLNLAERKELFPDLVRLASWGHGSIQSARDAILALPRDWVLERVEAVAEPLLAASTEEYQFEEYRRLLELYDQLGDKQLLRRLADRALMHPNEDIREAGQDFCPQ